MNLSLATFQRWHDALAQVYSRVNSEKFSAALVDALGVLIKIESVMVTLEHKDRAPELLYEHGIPPDKRELIVNRYFSVGYLLDPFSLAVNQGFEQGFFLLSEIAPDDFYDSAYYQTYYQDAGSTEDCYFVVDIGANSKLSICLYHGQTNYRYTQQELALLRAVEPIIRPLLLTHWRDQLLGANVMTQPQKQYKQQHQFSALEAAFSNFGSEILTARERDVTHLILRGHSSKSAARQLNISPETVREHRKNLYRKLSVNSQSQLFSLFIETVSTV